MKPSCYTVLVLTLFATAAPHACGQRAEVKRISISDDVALHYVERGDGEPIIFVHGLTGDYSVWLRQLTAFAKENYRAIAYSRRYNFPNDNDLAPNHSATVEAGDLAALIGKLGIKEAHLVGHSYGAYAALMLALERPELVRTLTLAEPPIVPWLSSLSGEQSEDGREQAERLFTEGVEPARVAFGSGDDELAMRLMMDAIGGKGTSDKLPGPVLQRCRRNLKDMKAIVTSPNAYPEVARERVRRLKVPTLILSGGNSVATAKWTDPELEQLLPEETRKRVVFPDATHIMWVQKPVECRRAVLQFIRGK
ncbi:MAG: alpha/beta hydrolase [Planctomycetota bacterium]